MEELIKLLENIKTGIDYNECEDLITGRRFDSFEILKMISDIEDKFEVLIMPDDIVPETFDSVKNLWLMIEQLRSKK